MNIKFVWLVTITWLFIVLSACSTLPGWNSPPLGYQYDKKSLVKLIQKNIGHTWGGVFNQTKVEISNNGNIIYHGVFKSNYGNWITDCKYYLEVDKDTSIIVGYKITDENPDENCKLLSR